MTKVSIIVPVVRYEKFSKMVASLGEAQAEIIAVAEKDPGIPGVTFVEAPESMSAVERWNLGASRSSGDYLVLGADDITFEDGCLNAAVRGMELLGGHGVVSFNDHTGRGDFLATHFMMSRGYAIADMGGVLVPPAYRHYFVDNEVTSRAKRDMKFVYVEEAGIKHPHPALGTGEKDKWHDAAAPHIHQDWEVFQARQEEGFKNDWQPVVGWPETHEDAPKSLAIAPRVYKYPDVDFFTSWTNLMLFGMNAGDFVILPEQDSPPAHIAANIAVQKFLRTGRDYLLFIDDDMVFRRDAALLLRREMDENPEIDIMMAFCTHRTWPPHAVVMRETETQPGKPVSLAGVRYGTLAVDERSYDSIIDVDAVGLAFTMIRREVLEALTNEYGAGQTYDYVHWGPGYMGEDLAFSRRAQKRGFRLAVSTKVKIGHVGRRTMGWDDHQLMLANRGKSE